MAIPNVYLNSSYLSKFFESPCLLLTMMTKERREQTKANPRKPMEPLFRKSSLFQRLKIAGAPNRVDAAVWFSTSGTGGAVGGGVAGDESACFVVAGSWGVVMFVGLQYRKVGERRMKANDSFESLNRILFF